MHNWYINTQDLSVYLFSINYELYVVHIVKMTHHSTTPIVFAAQCLENLAGDKVSCPTMMCGTEIYSQN